MLGKPTPSVITEANQKGRQTSLQNASSSLSGRRERTKNAGNRHGRKQPEQDRAQECYSYAGIWRRRPPSLQAPNFFISSAMITSSNRSDPSFSLRMPMTSLESDSTSRGLNRLVHPSNFPLITNGLLT